MTTPVKKKPEMTPEVRAAFEDSLRKNREAIRRLAKK